MVRLMASDELIAELGPLHDLVEVYDRSGNRIATIVPSSAPPTAEDYAVARTLFSDEEVAAAQAEVGGFTTREVLDGLKS